MQHIRQNDIERKRKNRAEMKMSEAAYWHYEAADVFSKRLAEKQKQEHSWSKAEMPKATLIRVLIR